MSDFNYLISEDKDSIPEAKQVLKQLLEIYMVEGDYGLLKSIVELGDMDSPTFYAAITAFRIVGLQEIYSWVYEDLSEFAKSMTS
jgi:delta-aminolevulinic acid dehydratase/porphobilinogen synthase